MTAIFTGLGTGFERGSANILGGAGQLGGALLGRAGEGVSVNAANGNLLVTHRDEFLVGRGPDIGIARTYNSLGQWDGDNGDNWQQSTSRRIHSYTAGSSVKRTSGDGSDIEYTWDAAENAYVTTDGSGAYDQLTYDATGDVWTWTDGDSQFTETYELKGADWRITEHKDTDGNTLTFDYDTSNRVTRVTTANDANANEQSYVEYSYTGINITQITTGYTDANGTDKTIVRTSYAYDSDNRLEHVTTDLTPEDSTDNVTYVTTYGYDGTSNRITSISQTDGSSLAITGNNGPLIVVTAPRSRHTVSRGQTLSIIANLWDTDVETLKRYNKISNEDRILIGQVIETPNYRIQSGDTVSSIAEKFDVTVKSIADLNGLKGDDVNNIEVGNVLRIAVGDSEIKKIVPRRSPSIVNKPPVARGGSGGTLGGVEFKFRPAAGPYNPADKRGEGKPGFRTSRSNSLGYHTGIDILGRVGDPVFAPADGRVWVVNHRSNIRSKPSAGTSIIIKHGNNVQTRYLHLQYKSPTVKGGEKVKAGQLIGRIGLTGNSPGDPHVHFEIRHNNRPVNPEKYLPRRK